MKLFKCTAKAADRRYCFVSRHVTPWCNQLGRGDPIASIVEKQGVDTIDFELDESRGGLDLPDLVGTNEGFLIYSKRMADALETEFSLGPHETFPARLINKKKRVHAEDYVVLNPLGQVDCLDRSRSDMDEDGELVRIFGKAVLASAAVPTDRDIFRAQGVIGYIFSQRLVEFIGQQGFTNFVFEDLLVA